MSRGFASDVRITGKLLLERFDAVGHLVETLLIDNLVVTAGKAVIADRMKAAPAKAAMTHMAVGTSATAAAAGDTALIAEVAASRTALTSTTVTTNQIAYVCVFGAGVGTGALAEAGIFNAASVGDMLCRSNFSISKGALDSLTITWTLTVN